MAELENPRHELFAQKVASGLTRTAAYVAVFDCDEDSARANAARLMTIDSISARIAELLEAAADEAVISAAQILRDLETIKQRCMQGEEVMEMRDGELVGTGEWKFDSRGALKACELQGAHLGMWKQTHEHSGKVTLEQLLCGPPPTGAK